MQPAYNGYPQFNTRPPYPIGEYYAPQTPYPNGFPNGGGGGLDMPVYPDLAPAWATQQQQPQQPNDYGGQTPMPRPRAELSTRRPLGRPRTQKPARSAMKKPNRSASEPVPQLGRARTASDPNRYPTPTNSRPRAYSNAARDRPNHMFLSIFGTSELLLQNINPHVIKDLRHAFVALWPGPGALESDIARDNTWRVKFANTPWSSTGQEGIMALRMICQLFYRLHLTHDILNTINTSRAFPRIVFVETDDPGLWVHHFVAYFSRTGRGLTLVDPPDTVGEALGHRLRAAWPHKIASDRWVDDKTVYKINLKTPAFGAPTTDRHLFMSYALQEIRALGYEFVVSVPLAKRGPMGMGSRREVLVFKDRQFSGSRPGSRNAPR